VKDEQGLSDEDIATLTVDAGKRFSYLMK